MGLKRLASMTEGAHVASWLQYAQWKRSMARPSHKCETGMKQRSNASKQ